MINMPGVRRRSSWVLPLVVLLILAEFWTIVTVATYIGVGATILIILCISVIGAMLTRAQGQNFAARMQAHLAGGSAPEHIVNNTLGLLLAGIFLIIPGFLTDLIALALLIPPLRHATARRFMRRVTGTSFSGMAGFGRNLNENDNEIIDVTPKEDGSSRDS